MTFINDEIGKKIRKLRKNKNITLEELSSLIHKSKSTISKYEKGEISIDIETYHRTYLLSGWVNYFFQKGSAQFF